MSEWINPPEAPSHDWFRTIVWACCAAVCIGFWAGIVFAVIALVH